MPARLRVVVITRGACSVLPGLFDSLPSATLSSYELVVVDNASEQGPPACPEGTRLLQSSGDLGFGMAVNFAAADFEGEFLVLAQPSVVCGPGSLDQLVGAFDRWPTAGCSGPGPRAPREALVPWLPSSLLVVRRQAWEQIGGFDPSYLTAGADIDFCRRLGVAGWTSVVVPGAIAQGGEVGGKAVIAERRRAVRGQLEARYPSWHQAPLRWARLRAEAP